MAETAWLLDTSILVDLLRGSAIDTLDISDRLISVITAAELLAGCRNQREQRAVERELALYTTLWLEEAASQTALDLYRRFHLSHGAGFLDCLIAATAVTHGLPVTTLNLKHLAAFPDVQAEKPY